MTDQYHFDEVEDFVRSAPDFFLPGIDGQIGSRGSVLMSYLFTESPA